MRKTILSRLLAIAVALSALSQKTVSMEYTLYDLVAEPCATIGASGATHTWRCNYIWYIFPVSYIGTTVEVVIGASPLELFCEPTSGGIFGRSATSTQAPCTVTYRLPRLCCNPARPGPPYPCGSYNRTDQSGVSIQNPCTLGS